MNRRIWKQGERYYFAFYTKGKHYLLQCGMYKMHIKLGLEYR